MDETWLASALGPCPTCGNGNLTVVLEAHLRNLLCAECGSCWHAEQYRTHRIDAAASRLRRPRTVRRGAPCVRGQEKGPRRAGLGVFAASPIVDWEPTPATT